MNNLLICFSSILPSNASEEEKIFRENNYSLSSNWMLFSIPKQWDIVWIDNTIDNLNQLKNNTLISNLSNNRIKLILNSNNFGLSNKGAGEHEMCKTAFDSIKNIKYNWITYFTARHIIPNSWYFDNLNNLNNYDCVMSNPSFYYLNYLQSPYTENLYNDMIFSMKYDIFSKFVKSIDTENLLKFHKNSENHLYEFVKYNNFNTFELKRLGILRNDYKSHGWHLV